MRVTSSRAFNNETEKKVVRILRTDFQYIYEVEGEKKIIMYFPQCRVNMCCLFFFVFVFVTCSGRVSVNFFERLFGVKRHECCLSCLAFR